MNELRDGPDALGQDRAHAMQCAFRQSQLTRDLPERESLGAREKIEDANVLWVAGSKTVGADWKAPVLEGWEPPAGH